MILVVSDTHGYFDKVNQQIDYAEELIGDPITCVIHLGDFGVYKSQLHDFFTRRKMRFRRPLYFIDGNHEDFHAFDRLINKYNAFFTYLPRGAVNLIGGYRFLSLGGTGYIYPMSTERAALITDRQIDDCLSVPENDVDIIVTHDCPEGIGVPNTPGLEFYGETGFKRSKELVDHFKPKLWLFGHHHKWFMHQDNTTAYFGVSGIWRGFGLLDRDYQFKIIDHKLEWVKYSFINKILINLRLIKHNASKI